MSNAQHTPGPWIGKDGDGRFNSDTEWTCENDDFASVTWVPIWANGKVIALVVDGSNYYKSKDVELEANAAMIAAAPELLAYAECAEAHRASLLPVDQGGTGHAYSYMETFNRYGFDGRDVYGFLDRLRHAAIAAAKGGAA